MERIALITGGTGALGAAVTRSFLDEGYRVVVTWVVKEEAEALRDSLNVPEERLALVECDVTDPSDVARAFDDVERDIGPSTLSFT